MRKYKTRDEIPKQYKWNMNKIFKCKEDFDKNFEIITKEVETISSLKKDFIKSGKNLYKALIEINDLSLKVNNLYMYAKKFYDVDSIKSSNQELMSLVENLYVIFSSNVNFIETEIIKIKNINNFYNEEPKLKEFTYFIDEILRSKKHILSAKEENLLSLSSNIRNGYESVFENLEATDVKFSDFTIDNVKYELTHGNYSNYLKNDNPLVRKQAFINYHEYFKKHANTFYNCLINNFKNDNFLAKVKHYKSAIQMSMDSDAVPVSLFDNLVKTVHKNINLLHRFVSLKKKLNKLEEIHMYDMYYPMFKNKDKKYSVDEAISLVKNSLSMMPEEYRNVVSKCFAENWVDFYETPGKCTGAFSSGTYDTDPIILMNFDETFNSVETLAHELGHSMHSYYSHKYNPYQTSSYPILLAEIASNVGELLLFDYILKNSTDIDEKKMILETILSSFKGSIFRQTQFAEFEKAIHEKEQNNEPLSMENVTNYYLELNKYYYGNDFINDDDIKYECLRIPHFYYNFYVYKYATGLAVAYVFAKRIINKEKNAINDYIEFLKSGGRDKPLNVLKNCNVDLSQSKILDEAMELFNNYMTELENL